METSSQDKIFELESIIDDKEFLFHSILDSTLAGFWDWNIPNHTEYLSPTFKKMFGYEDHELENSPDSWQKIIHPDDLPGVLEVLKKHVKSRGEIPYDNEVRYYHKNGSIVWVYCRGKVVEWDENNQPIRMVGCHVDITELKNAQTKLENQKLILENQANELKELTYIVAHDLQEPIRSIIGFGEIIREDFKEKLGDSGSSQLDRIVNSSHRLSNLVKSLLDYTQLGVGKERQEIDCNEIISDVIIDLQELIRSNSVKIYFDKLPLINGFKREIGLLFQNLINNAIKFNRKESNPIINISASQYSGHWEFAVKDNGIGIEEYQKEKIFKIFQRLHNKNDYEGNGIGLSHCKKIIKLHNGSLRVESKPGEGSTFYFTIPV